MPAVHLLTDPTPGLTHVTVVCGARLPERGTWDVRAVTCAACLAPPRPAAHASSAPGVTEKAWLQQVRSLAHTNQWLTYHTLRSTGSEPGWVDLVLLRPPVLRLVELKVPGGRVTPQQQRWRDGLGQVDQVHTHLWYPADLPAVLEVLR